MHGELAKRYAAGEDFWAAREDIIQRDGRDMAKKYGAETAKRALAYLTSYGVEGMPAWASMSASDSYLDRAEARLNFAHGGDWRFSRWQRWLFRTFGITGIFSPGATQRGTSLYGDALKAHQDAYWAAEREKANDRRQKEAALSDAQAAEATELRAQLDAFERVRKACEARGDPF
jgi:hypothetical protein